MDIKYGLSENEVKSQAVKLAKNKELTIEVNNNDTIYYRNLEIDGSVYKCRIYFNSDRLSSGPLRSYEYLLTTLPYSESGNDTSNKSYVNKTKVFKASDFEKLKSYLDKKYGTGIFYNERWKIEKDTIYKYETENADLFLIHNTIENDKYYGIAIKVPFYTSASLLIKSKSYNVDFKKEYENRRKELKPIDVLGISFNVPSLENSYNEYGKSVSKIVFKVTSENYKTYVIDDDIVDCKGVLSIVDAYGDTLQHAELIYKFNPPLTKKRVVWKTNMDYNVYELNPSDPAFDKISALIKSGEILKVLYKPTAIVLEDGSVIK